jgi:hypothetical protein
MTARLRIWAAENSQTTVARLPTEPAFPHGSRPGQTTSSEVATTDSNSTDKTTTLKAIADYQAPDGSEIRLLLTMNGGGLCHASLPSGSVALPVSPRLD